MIKVFTQPYWRPRWRSPNKEKRSPYIPCTPVSQRSVLYTISSYTRVRQYNVVVGHYLSPSFYLWEKPISKRALKSRHCQYTFERKHNGALSI